MSLSEDYRHPKSAKRTRSGGTGSRCWRLKQCRRCKPTTVSAAQPRGGRVVTVNGSIWGAHIFTVTAPPMVRQTAAAWEHVVMKDGIPTADGTNVIVIEIVILVGSLTDEGEMIVKIPNYLMNVENGDAPAMHPRPSSIETASGSVGGQGETTTV